jgi:hypothetical protein
VQDGWLLLRYAVTFAIGGKVTLESEAFPYLPQVSGWTWEIVRSALTELSDVSGRSVQTILRALHNEVLERYDTTKETLGKGFCTIQANYVLNGCGTDLTILYHARITDRIAKWASVRQTHLV